MKTRARIDLALDELGPFFEPRHHALADRLRSGLLAPLEENHDSGAVARAMGELGLYAYLVPEAFGGAASGRADAPTYIDVRSLVLIREALAQASPLADAIFAVQGLGSYPIVLAGSEAQRARLLPEVIAGRRVCAFGLTEPEAGSDVASMRTTARREGDDWILDGEKTLISNVPIARHHVVFANADPPAKRQGITAFIVERDAPGLELEPIPMSITHPIGRLRLRGCRVPASAQIGGMGGFKLAMATLDTFRISVGAAANGMAAHALRAAITHARSRRQFGAPLADQQIIKAKLADMATELDAARLLVARAAHRRDTAASTMGVALGRAELRPQTPGSTVTAAAAMAKMFATEAAQQIIDQAVQIHGGMGVALGTPVEALYREIRPLRIYEGATEIQKLVIAKALLDRAAAEEKASS